MSAGSINRIKLLLGNICIDLLEQTLSDACCFYGTVGVACYEGSEELHVRLQLAGSVRNKLL